jgi:hypothetical protein
MHTVSSGHKKYAEQGKVSSISSEIFRKVVSKGITLTMNHNLYSVLILIELLNNTLKNLTNLVKGVTKMSDLIFLSVSNRIDLVLQPSF